MELIFVLVFIKAIDLPIYIGSGWEFIGWDMLKEFVCEFRNIIAMLCVIGIIWGEIAYILFKHQLKGSPTTIADTLRNVKNKDVEYLSLLLTILTVACFDFSSLRDVLIFVIVFVLYWIITIHTELYVTNPLLRCRGMHLYSATTDMIRDEVMLLSFEELKPLQDVNRQYKIISKHVYVLYPPKTKEKQR